MTDPAALSSALIGEIFVERGHITHDQLEEALVAQAETGELLGEILVGRFGVPRVELAGVLAEQWAMMERTEMPRSVAAPASDLSLGEDTPTARPAPPAPVEDGSERRPIGEIFVEHGVVSQSQLDAAVLAQRDSGQRLGEVLVAQGAITRLELASALAEQWSTLQKIRPPEPKAAEPWQESAVRAAGSDPDAPPAPLAVPPADVEHLRDAVQALEERLRTVSATASASPPDEKLRETTAALSARIDELEGRLETTASPELGELQGSIEEIREAIGSLDERVRAVGALAPSPDVELVETIAALTARIAELEARLDVAASPDLGEIHGSIGDVRDAITALEARIEAASAMPNESDNELIETTASLTARIGELEGRLDAAAAPDLGGIHGAIDEVRDAVRGLEGRLEAVSAAPSVPDAELVATTAALTARIDELEGRLEAASSPELGEIRASLVELRARLDEPDPTVAELKQRLETTVDGLLERIETLNNASVDDAALGGLRDSVAGLQQQTADLAARDEVDAIRVVLGAVSEQVKELAGRSGGVTHEDLDRQLSLAIGDLREQVAGATARHDDEGISELRAAIAALEAQLGALQEPGLASETDAALDEVRARIDGLMMQVAQAQQESAARLGEVVGAEQAERLALADSVGDALGRLGDLDELRARVEALATPNEAVDVALRPVEDRLAALAHHVDEVREVALARAASPGAEDLEQLNASVADLGARLREVASRPSGVSQDQLERRLADVVAALEAQSSSNAVTVEIANEVAAIQQAVASIELRFADTVGASTIAGIESTVAQIGSRVEDLSRTVADATRSLELRDGPSTDDLDALVAGERTAREELAARVNELSSVPLTDEHARGELAVLREQLAALAERPDQTRELDELRQRVSELAERPDQGAALAELRQRVAELAERPDRNASQTDELDELRQRISELAARPSQEAVLEELRHDVAALADLPQRLAALDELQQKVSELAALPRHDAALDELRHRVAELGDRVDNRDGLTALEQALVARHEAEAAARGALEAQLGQLRNDLQGLASVDWVTTLEQAAREGTQAVNDRLAGLELRLVDAYPTSELEQLHALVADLTSRVGTVDSSLSDLGEGVEATVAKALRKGLEHTVAPEALAQMAADLYARLAAVESAGAPTREALDELGMRLGATEQQAWALPEQLDDRFGRLQLEVTKRIDDLAAAYDPAVAALQARLDELARAQAAELERLAGIEQAAASTNVRLEGLEARHAHEGTIGDQITELTNRLDNELALADERGTAVERAIRKGLASLGERLTANEESYLESGAALRRSIERLGAAVVEADTRLADLPLDPPANGYVAFVPTPDGYRLRPLDGAAPSVGEIIEVQAASGPLRVARIARSPLPLDRRACAYLEHV